MKVKASALLCALVLAASAFAGDKKDNDNLLPNPGQISVQMGGPKWNPFTPPVQFTGVFQYVAWSARTGKIYSDPSQNFCPIVEARLTFGLGFFANLYAKEVCGGGFLVREVDWDVVLWHDGRLAMMLPKFSTVTYSDGTTEKVENQAIIKEHTGCPVYNGTFPMFYGHFDGKFFHAVSEFQGVCTGGTMWGPLYGISEAVGPVHADFLMSLEAKP